jgi:hypothetical protein
VKGIMQRMQMADRLHLVTQQIGFALWQLQELEGVSAQYFVLLAKATKGMGEAAGNALLDKAQKNTFGTTIRHITEHGLLSKYLELRFRHLLSERNWLVHRSRADSRDAIHNDASMQKLLLRIDSMATETLALLKEIGSLSSNFVKKHGVTEEYINKKADELLKQWHSSEQI